MWNNSKTEILSQLKLLQNSKTQIVTKLTKSIYDKTQIVTKLKTVVMVTVVTAVTVTVVSVLTVTVGVVTLVWVTLVTIAVVTVVVVIFFFLVKTTWHLLNRWDFSGQLFAVSQCFFSKLWKNRVVFLLLFKILLKYRFVLVFSWF